MSLMLVTGSIPGLLDLTGHLVPECQNQDIKLLLSLDLDLFGYLVCKIIISSCTIIIQFLIGGRDGSRILQSNEILYYPGSYNINGHNVIFSKWVWASERMIQEAIWEKVIPNGMKELPLPLAGHCVVDIRK